MDLFTIAGACLRRWYFTVPLLLLVAFASYRAYDAVEPLYTSSRSIVVLPNVAETVVPPEEVGFEREHLIAAGRQIHHAADDDWRDLRIASRRFVPLDGHRTASLRGRRTRGASAWARVRVAVHKAALDRL